MMIKPGKKKFAVRLVNFLATNKLVHLLCAWFFFFIGMYRMSNLLKDASQLGIEIGWLPLLLSVFFAYSFLLAGFDAKKKINRQVFSILLGLPLFLPSFVYLASLFIKMDPIINESSQVANSFVLSGIFFLLSTKKVLLKPAIEEKLTQANR